MTSHDGEASTRKMLSYGLRSEACTPALCRVNLKGTARTKISLCNLTKADDNSAQSVQYLKLGGCRGGNDTERVAVTFSTLQTTPRAQLMSRQGHSLARIDFRRTT